MKARKSTLLIFFNHHHLRYKQVNEKRINSIKSAFVLTDDLGGFERSLGSKRGSIELNSSVSRTFLKRF